MNMYSLEVTSAGRSTTINFSKVTQIMKEHTKGSILFYSKDDYLVVDSEYTSLKMLLRCAGFFEIIKGRYKLLINSNAIRKYEVFSGGGTLMYFSKEYYTLVDNEYDEIKFLIEKSRV